MKLKYQKPMVAVERFELSQSIAACTIKIGFTNNACVQQDEHTPLEMFSIAVQYPMYFAGECNEAGQFDVINNDIVPKDDLCYHTQTNATFNS